MDINFYINWELARMKLSQFADEVVDAMRVCDIAQLAEDPNLWSTEDLDVGQFIDVSNLSEAQIQELSEKYIESVASIKKMADMLNSTEVNEPCPKK